MSSFLKLPAHLTMEPYHPDPPSASSTPNSTSISTSHVAAMTLAALVGAALTPPEASLAFAANILTRLAGAIGSAASTAWAHGPSALDVALALALYNLHLWAKVRNLNPYGKAANQLLLSVRHSAPLSTTLALFHALKLLTTLHPPRSAYLPLPAPLALLLALATHTLALVVGYALLSRYPDDIPLDTNLWEFRPKPAILVELGVGDHMNRVTVVRVRARGVEPEYWRLGPRPDSPKLGAAVGKVEGGGRKGSWSSVSSVDI